MPKKPFEGLTGTDQDGIYCTISTISDSIIDKFLRFDPANDPKAIERFTSLLGLAILDLENFKYEQLKFSNALKLIAEHYGLSTNGLYDK